MAPRQRTVHDEEKSYPHKPINCIDVSDSRSPKRTHFGLEVINDKLVRLSDIEALPFAEFWRESSSGSTMLVDSRTGETFVYLHDWEAFAELFIKTGKHRYQAR